MSSSSNLCLYPSSLWSTRQAIIPMALSAHPHPHALQSLQIWEPRFLQLRSLSIDHNFPALPWSPIVPRRWRGHEEETRTARPWEPHTYTYTHIVLQQEQLWFSSILYFSFSQKISWRIEASLLKYKISEKPGVAHVLGLWSLGGQEVRIVPFITASCLAQCHKIN